MKKIFVLSALLIFGAALCSCSDFGGGGYGGDIVIPKSDKGGMGAYAPVESSETMAEDESDETVPLSDRDAWRLEYGVILDKTADEFSGSPGSGYNTYTLHDIDDDGIPELFVKTGTCEADYMFRVYTLDKQTKKAVYIDEVNAGWATVSGIDTKNTFLIQSGHQNVEMITAWTLENGMFTESVLFCEQVSSYHELVNEPVYNYPDKSGLKWYGNTPENNREIIENYSVTDSLISAIEGVWVVDGTLYRQDAFVTFEFYIFEGGRFYGGVYPGEFDRVAEIEDVVIENGMYTVKLYYPSEERYGQYYEEFRTDLKLNVYGDKIDFVDYDFSCLYMGNTLDEAIRNAAEGN